MSMSLKAQALRGVFWSLLERIGQQGMQFVITIVLARLLVPEQFGLIGMLLVFIEVSWVFMDSGFEAALIQRKEATIVHECSIFYFNILVGVLAAGLLCAAAPWIAAFYRQPILTPLIYALSVAILLNSLACVHGALLRKRIDFKTLLKVGMGATALSGAISIAMAVQGFGVWSLVAQCVGGSFFRTLFLWLLSPWHPRLIYRTAALREMFGFSVCVLGVNLFQTIFQNIYLVVIGRLFSPMQLGLYSGAVKMQRLPTVTITAVIARVAFPAFASIQDDPVLLKRSMRKAVTTLALVHFPLLVGLALTARPLVEVLLTEKWAASVPWLQLLCLASLSDPFQAVHLNVLEAKGRSDLFFLLVVPLEILAIVLMVITCRWGVTGMIWGQILMGVVAYYLCSYYTVRLVHYSRREQLADLAPYAAVSALMGFGLYLIQLVPWAGNAVLLVTEVLLGVLLYLALGYVFRLSALFELAHVVKNALRPSLPIA